MQVKEFQDLAMCTNDGKCTERLFIDSKAAYEIGEIINAALGLGPKKKQFERKGW